jgi:pantoate--beta-alanine ligase
MRLIRAPQSMQRLALAWQRQGENIGFVPTMGALHAGHLSLIHRARRENKRVVVSVFVNPAQFGRREDLSRYLRPFARDTALCRKARVDAVFCPRAEAMYPPGFQTWVEVGELSRPLEGQFRPGHFRGVATVVAKLFAAVQPTRAYFGQKDFQQLRVIQQMAKDLDLSVKIVPCPTVREPDGLAMSSRNSYLSPDERRAAAGIWAALKEARRLLQSGTRISPERLAQRVRARLAAIPGARLDYAAVVDPVTLAPLRPPSRKALVATALRLGRTRLIDNILVNFPGSKKR